MYFIVSILNRTVSTKQIEEQTLTLRRYRRATESEITYKSVAVSVRICSVGPNEYFGIGIIYPSEYLTVLLSFLVGCFVVAVAVVVGFRVSVIFLL